LQNQKNEENVTGESTLKQEIRQNNPSRESLRAVHGLADCLQADEKYKTKEVESSKSKVTHVSPAIAQCSQGLLRGSGIRTRAASN
jgi:hypothetical protein